MVRPINDGGTTIAVTWIPVEQYTELEVDAYIIYCEGVGKESFGKLKDVLGWIPWRNINQNEGVVNGTQTSEILSGLVSGEKYRFTIRSYCKDCKGISGLSAFSEPSAYYTPFQTIQWYIHGIISILCFFILLCLFYGCSGYCFVRKNAPVNIIEEEEVLRILKKLPRQKRIRLNIPISYLRQIKRIKKIFDSENCTTPTSLAP